MYVCIRACVNVCMCACLYVFKFVCVYACVCMYVCMYGVHACMQFSLYVRLNVCMCATIVCMHGWPINPTPTPKKQVAQFDIRPLRKTRKYDKQSNDHPKQKRKSQAESDDEIQMCTCRPTAKDKVQRLVLQHN